MTERKIYMSLDCMERDHPGYTMIAAVFCHAMNSALSQAMGGPPLPAPDLSQFTPPRAMPIESVKEISATIAGHIMKDVGP